MKPTSLIAFVILSSASSFADAANLLSPSLITPRNNEFSATNKPLKFTWGEPKDPSTIKNYHLIISKDERFTNYSQGAKKCEKPSNCADFIMNKSEFVLADTHPFLQKKGSFFWQVQAIGKNGETSLIFQGSESTSSGKANVRKQVNIGRFSVGQKNIIIDQYSVEPPQAANGSAFKFAAKIDDELSSNQHLKIKISEEDWQDMKGAGLTYRLLQLVNVDESSKNTVINYHLAIFNDAGEMLGTQRDGDFTVLAEGEIVTLEDLNTPPTLQFISGTESVDKNKSYTIKLKANDDDGNLSRIEVVWGDGSATDSKPAKNNASLSFTHTYKFGGLQNLVANAIDDLEFASESFTKSVTVIEKLAIPKILNTTISPNPIEIGTSATFNATLGSALPSGYSVKINYGLGLIQMNGSGTSFNLPVSFNALGSNLFTVGIYDTKNALKSNQLTGNFSVIEPAPVVSNPVESSAPAPLEHVFNYTKISNDGSELPKDAKLGTNPKDWACTKDNNTGLMWEVKTNDGGLRDKDSIYSWYEPDEAKNGGNAGKKRSYEYKNWCKGSECDINDYAQTVNNQRLCGIKNWRVPSQGDLMSLIYCSDKQYNDETGECVSVEVTAPTIDDFYFPNTLPTNTDWDGIYWTMTLHPIPERAYDVSFTNGLSYPATKGDGYSARLVSNSPK